MSFRIAFIRYANVRAGEGWEPVIKIPQFQEDLVCSFWSAADIKSHIVSSIFQLTFLYPSTQACTDWERGPPSAQVEIDPTR